VSEEKGEGRWIRVLHSPCPSPQAAIIIELVKAGITGSGARRAGWGVAGTHV
jgi:hypothetical protein